MVFLDKTASAFDYAIEAGSYKNLVKLLEKYPNAAQINQQIGFTYMKESSYGYRTVVKADTGYVIIYFYPDNILMGYKSITLSDQCILDSMLQLKSGLNISEVRLLDPNANYAFLYTGSSQMQKISFHYFPDGNVFEIYYSDQLEITEIAHYII